ncbi:MAG: hypothetical protein WEA76_05695 [Acidimicrobiia bacterium]
MKPIERGLTVNLITKEHRKTAKRLGHRGEQLLGDVTDAGERFASRAADKSERAFKTATKAAERALSDLTDAATDLYDDHKDDAEDLLREAGNVIGASVGSAASSLKAMLPSARRRRRRRRVGMLTVAGVILAVVGYQYWSARQTPAESSSTATDEHGSIGVVTNLERSGADA